MLLKKPLEWIAYKWCKRSLESVGDYVAGVMMPRRDWRKASLEASDRWRVAVVNAAARGSFKVGVARTPTALWQVKLGAFRFSNGVLESVDKFTVYCDALSKVMLPGRGPKGDPRNIERIRVIVETLRRVKLATE